MSSALNNSGEAEIVFASAPGEVAAIRELFQEYAAGLAIDLCFQNFERELATLPGGYAPPNGFLLLARVDGQSAGCIALRPMEDGIGEIKRLYVRQAFRRRGLGRRLVECALGEARRIGCGTVRLDTLREMSAAIALYAAFGFREVAPYRPCEPAGICYFELKL
jgi:putative acetyltransferase